MRAIIVRKKFWGLQMLTWVWLARAKHELTKPKSTFCPQNFLSGLRVPHVQSFPFPTVAGPDSGQWAHSGQLSPGGSRRGWPPVAGGGCRVGSCRRIPIMSEMRTHVYHPHRKIHANIIRRQHILLLSDHFLTLNNFQNKKNI